jgi:transcriptional regulator with XRE-family HTH domain
MSISPSQCRAARALLNWSQDELSERAGVSKRTIADLELGAHFATERTSNALQETLEASGVVFIPANGGGPGVRLSMALPRLVRRDDIVDMSHVAFRFEHKNKRHTAFVDYAALATLAAGHPLKVFDGHLQRLLRLAADLADGGRIAEDDTIRVKAADLKAKGKAR